jgi:hypothetical protein
MPAITVENYVGKRYESSVISDLTAKGLWPGIHQPLIDPSREPGFIAAQSIPAGKKVDPLVVPLTDRTIVFYVTSRDGSIPVPTARVVHARHTGLDPNRLNGRDLSLAEAKDIIRNAGEGDPSHVYVQRRDKPRDTVLAAFPPSGSNPNWHLELASGPSSLVNWLRNGSL